MAVEDANIKVYVRCRNTVASADDEQSPYGMISPKEFIKKTDPSKRYCFDRIFSPESSQEDVFEECARPLIDELIKGYNGTLFAYGQTGTGKTYTMTGECVSSTESERAGIVPRVLETVFDRLETSSQDWILELKYIELYNEELRDLFHQQGAHKERSASSTVTPAKQLRIVEGHNKSIEVMGAISVPVTNLESALAAVRDATSRRQTATTRLNVDSSRSHTVLTLILVSREPVSGMAVRSKLHLVDLAGSENVAKSGAVRIRAQEAGEINKSLLSLGRVIEMLVSSEKSRASMAAPREVGVSSRYAGSTAKTKPYVSYRDSKLTHLLQDSLGGSTKTRMVATVSLMPHDADETKSTLIYASRARSIRNQVQTEVEVMDRHITLKELAKQLEDTQHELRMQRSRDGGAYLSNYNYHQLKNGQRKYAELLAQKETELKHQELRLGEISIENATLLADRNALQAQVTDLVDKSQKYQMASDTTMQFKASTETAINAFAKYSNDVDIVARNLYEKLDELPQMLEKLTMKLQALLSNSAHITTAAGSLELKTKQLVEEHKDSLKEQLIRHFNEVADSMTSAVNRTLSGANSSISQVQDSLALANEACSKLQRQFESMQADIAMQQSTSSEALKVTSMLEEHEREYNDTMSRLALKRKALIETLVTKQRQTAMPRLSSSASHALDLVTGIREAVSQAPPLIADDDVSAEDQRTLYSKASEKISSTIEQDLSEIAAQVVKDVQGISQTCQKDFEVQEDQHAQAINKLMSETATFVKGSIAIRGNTLPAARDAKAAVFEELRKMSALAKTPSSDVRQPAISLKPSRSPSPRKSPQRLVSRSGATGIRNGIRDQPSSPARTRGGASSRAPLRPIASRQPSIDLTAHEYDFGLNPPLQKVNSLDAESRPFKSQLPQKQRSRRPLPPAKKPRTNL